MTCGGAEVKLHSISNLIYEIHAPAILPLGKESALEAWCVPESGLSAFENIKYLLFVPGIEPRFIGRPSSSLVSILTELSRLLATT
jgi:hypothetical protein